MGEVVTVVGASGSTIAVTLDGARAIELAKKFSADLMAYRDDDGLNIFNMGSGDSVDGEYIKDKTNEGINTDGGNAFTVTGAYNYIVTGGLNAPWNPASPIFLEKPVTIVSDMKKGQKVNVLAGGNKGVTYKAGQEGGIFVAGNSGSDVVFEGNSVTGGNWEIATGAGNDSIFTGSGNTIVNADTGNNTIKLGTGSNTVNSEGNDTITGPNGGGFNTLNLYGSSEYDYHATVDVGNGTLVNDFNAYNVITVGGGSTVAGGMNSTITFDGSYDKTASWLQGVQNSTISSNAGDVNVSQGQDNNMNIDGNLIFLNGGGNTNASVSGSFTGFGVQGLNLTLNSNSDKGTLFIGSAGNETLNASSLTVGFQVYAYNTVGASSNLSVIGGSGNDLFAAGTGNSTFTGGSGADTFTFTKESDAGGNTLITDFSKSQGDKIALFDYGLDANSLQELLNNSKDENGSAVLNLDNHKITLQNVSVSELNVDQFTIYNTPTKTS